MTKFVFNNPPGGRKWDSGENLVRHPSTSGFAEWLTQDRGQTGEVPAYAKKDRTDVALQTLGTTVETKRDLGDIPHPVPPVAIDNLEKRLIDIYGSKECREWYINAVKESLEKMSEDDLYEFIRKHPKYSQRNEHVQWNRDFAALFHLDIPKEFRTADENLNNRRITAAAQHMLVKFYQHDVFQITQKVVNPWIFIDGRMGPYTVSVLNVYWSKRFGRTSKRLPNPPGDSGLGFDKDYKPNSREAALYAAAISYRNTQIRESGNSGGSGDTPPAPTENQDAAAKARYEQKDKAKPEDVTWDKLKIDSYSSTKRVSVAAALLEAYHETEGNAPRTQRILNLLAKQKGRDIEGMQIGVGEVLMIDASGTWTHTRADATAEVINLNAPPKADRPNPEAPAKPESKDQPAKTEPPKPAGPSSPADEKVKRRYAKLDKAPADFDNAQLVIRYECLTESSLSEALALAYGEDPKPSDTANSKRTFRVLNLLAQRSGARIESVRIRQGDVIEITPAGKLTIYRNNKPWTWVQIF